MDFFRLCSLFVSGTRSANWYDSKHSNLFQSTLNRNSNTKGYDKKALSRAGVEPAPLGEKYRPSELPCILIVTFKKKEEKELGVGAYISGCLLTKPSCQARKRKARSKGTSKEAKKQRSNGPMTGEDARKPYSVRAARRARRRSFLAGLAR